MVFVKAVSEVASVAIAINRHPAVRKRKRRDV